LGTLPGAAADRTRPPEDVVLARMRGEDRGRRGDANCDGATSGMQQVQPRNDNRRAEGIGRFLSFLSRFKSVPER
jgi:hypothetical protein